MLVDTTATITPAANWKIIPFMTGQPDFVADLALPSSITDAGVMCGFIFRAASAVSPSNFTNSYMLMFSAGSVILYQLTSWTILERIVDPFAGLGGIPGGTIRLSVQGNRISLWVNHSLLHTFNSSVIPTGNYGAMAVFNPNLNASFTFGGRVSELNELLADVTVGVRGKGMSVVNEMVNGRGVTFRCEPDGGLHFFKTPTSIGSVPDIVISVQHDQVDDEVSRTRVEGIKIVESAGFDQMRMNGNVFETINSKYADTVNDLLQYGVNYRNHLRQRSELRTIEAVFHPALQPGDLGSFNLEGNIRTVGVMATNLALGFNGENLDVNYSLQAYTQ
jgi:hypothetical protein